MRGPPRRHAALVDLVDEHVAHPGELAIADELATVDLSGDTRERMARQLNELVPLHDVVIHDFGKLRGSSF